MNEQDERKPRIKVVDRRWFTEDGTLRRDRPRSAPRPEPVPETTGPAGEGAGSATERASESAPGEGAGERAARGSGVSWPSAVSFLQLVDFLAQQALLLLQGAEGLPANPAQARVFIDFLGLLEERTRGNLTPEEARALSDVLFQLRTLFVRHAGR